jgi:hypothetical protein
VNNINEILNGYKGMISDSNNKNTKVNENNVLNLTKILYEFADFNRNEFK